MPRGNHKTRHNSTHRRLGKTYVSFHHFSVPLVYLELSHSLSPGCSWLIQDTYVRTNRPGWTRGRNGRAVGVSVATRKKENGTYSSNFWYFLQSGVAMNRFQIFHCEYYIFSYALQLFLHNSANFTFWQCNCLKLRRMLISNHYWVTMYF